MEWQQPLKSKQNLDLLLSNVPVPPTLDRECRSRVLPLPVDLSPLLVV